ncbi:MAG: UbiX family flavin prenyltransferase [Candidatus Nitrosocaldus sp.]|nr:UbiX family flavin prenyltransferase [Candidatus Nitrosocaldus sp.]MDW8275364.1 UbiX family flavin prenyltransferase [Candidatus Nitrosocaldus sp.]
MRILVCISGGSGVVYGIRLLEALKTLGVESHLIMSRWAEECIRLETDLSVEAVRALADHVYSNEDLAARPSSGSFKLDGTVIIPCSMKTLASIALGLDETLISRAAMVAMKESRKLVLVPRETPLTAVHIEHMLNLARLGVVILPAMPGFYHRPRSIDDLINHIVGKVLDQFGIEHDLFRRWEGR